MNNDAEAREVHATVTDSEESGRPVNGYQDEPVSDDRDEPVGRPDLVGEDDEAIDPDAVIIAEDSDDADDLDEADLDEADLDEADLDEATTTTTPTPTPLLHRPSWWSRLPQTTAWSPFPGTTPWPTPFLRTTPWWTPFPRTTPWPSRFPARNPFPLPPLWARSTQPPIPRPSAQGCR